MLKQMYIEETPTQATNKTKESRIEKRAWGNAEEQPPRADCIRNQPSNKANENNCEYLGTKLYRYDSGQKTYYISISYQVQ